MEKIVIGSGEISAVAPPSPDQPPRLEPKLPPPVPLWAKLALIPLVFVLPILCIVTLIVRVAMRGLPPRTRFAWLSYLSTLMIISGILTSVVAVITPGRRTWFNHNEVPSNGFGAGVLLEATPKGYLLVTARHVIDESAFQRGSARALVAMASGTWAGADVIARHKNLDLCLIWLPRESGNGEFVQPVEPKKEISEGENIYVIGHPQGLRFTLSTGIISRTDNDTLQMTAPVSPGNSGGPVY